MAVHLFVLSPPGLFEVFLFIGFIGLYFSLSFWVSFLFVF